jgi:hypothetical protein
MWSCELTISDNRLNQKPSGRSEVVTALSVRRRIVAPQR